MGMGKGIIINLILYFGGTLVFLYFSFISEKSFFRKGSKITNSKAKKIVYVLFRFSFFIGFLFMAKFSFLNVLDFKDIINGNINIYNELVIKVTSVSNPNRNSLGSVCYIVVAKPDLRDCTNSMGVNIGDIVRIKTSKRTNELLSWKILRYAG